MALWHLSLEQLLLVNTKSLFFYIKKNEKTLILDPRILSVKLDQLDPIPLRKKSFVLYNHQSHFISQVTRKQLWKVSTTYDYGTTGHAQPYLNENINLTFSLSSDTTLSKQNWRHAIFPSGDIYEKEFSIWLVNPFRWKNFKLYWIIHKIFETSFHVK